MPYTRELLKVKYAISDFDVELTLSSANLPLESPEYTDDQERDFGIIRSYFRDGLATSYEQAAELFKASQSEVKKTSSANSPKKQSKSLKTQSPIELASTDNDEKSYNIAELLAQVKEVTGARVSLGEAAKILSIIGLEERDDYSVSESKRFVEACKLFHENRPNVANIIGDAAALSEDGLLDLVEKVTGSRAENIPELVNHIYLQKVSEKLEDSKSKIKEYYEGLEEQVLARIEGKSRRRSIMEAAWIPTSLNISPEKPMLLSPESNSELIPKLPEKSTENDEP